MNKTEVRRCPVSQMEGISSTAILHPQRFALRYPSHRNLSHPIQANSTAEAVTVFWGGFSFSIVTTHSSRIWNWGI